MRKSLALVFAAGTALGAFAATRYWSPTALASDGKYYWTNANNWLDDSGNTGVPVAGDTVVMTNSSNVWGIQSTRLHAFILRPTRNGDGLSGAAVTFAAGSPGIRLETAKSVAYWMGITAPANYDLPIYVCEGGTLGGSESYSGSGRFLKQGLGELKLGSKTGGATRFKWGGTVIEAGTFGMGACDMELTNHEFVFAGPTARALLYSNQTLKNANFHEADGMVPGSHSIDASAAYQLIFTGTPARQATTFTGRLDRKAGVTWSPGSADYSFVFSKATSGTEGTLAVTEGTVRLADGATFVQLGALEVAANGTFAVDAGSGMGFRAGTMTLASGATLALGDGVKILAASATYAGNALADGTYTSADGVGITGNGVLVVRASPPAASSAVWTGGGETASVTDPANWGAETLPALDDGSLTATFAGGGSTALLGASQHLDFAGWNLSGGFTFAAAEGAGYVELEAGGMTAADAAAPTPYTLGWPLVLHGAQTWTLGQNNTLHIHAPLVGAGGLTVNGKGCVNFSTPSSYAGDVLLTNGTFYVTATNACGGPGGTLKFTPGFGQLHFGGTIALDRPFTAVIDADDNYKPTYVDANATVDFNRKVYFQSRQRSIIVQEGAVARFHGGFSADRCFRFSGSGTVVIDTEPLSMGDRFYLYGPTIELNVASNRINGNVGSWSLGTIKTGVPYALSHKVLSTTQYQRILLAGATIDLCGNDQSIGILGCASGSITSAAPATFHLVDDYENAEPQFGSGSRQTNSVPFKGCVSFAKEGRLNYWLKAVSPTYGDLSVTNGTLTVMPAASWANASNVTASCAGVLKVQNKEAFGRQAVVHIDGADARMLLDYSGSMKVYGLYIDGQKQPLGVYGGTASGAPRKLACFGDTGTGQLAVLGDGIGMTVIFR